MALIGSGQWPSIAQRDLTIVFLDQFRKGASMLPLVYRFKEAEQGTEYLLETGDIGEVPEFNGEVSYDDIREGYKKAISETEYALGIKLTRRVMRNDLYGVIQDRTRLLADAFRHLQETRGAFPFVNAFNTSFTVGDGLQLCSNSHTSKYVGGSQDNLNTLALSAANLQTARIAMKKLKTNRDNPMVNIPDTLIIPMDLEDTAFELIKSMGKVDTANNNRNYHFGRYKVIVWDNYLSDTNDWFLVNSERMKQSLVYLEWEPVQFFRSGEFDSMVAKLAGYTAFEIGAVEWRWVYGCQVS